MKKPVVNMLVAQMVVVVTIAKQETVVVVVARTDVAAIQKTAVHRSKIFLTFYN